MTGLIEQISGAAFSPGNVVLPPLPALPTSPAVTALWCYPGTDLAHSQNLMGAPAITQLGTPTYQPGYISGCLGGASPIGLDTHIPDDAIGNSFSILFAARHTGATDAQTSVPIGNVDNSTAFGVNIGMVGTGTFQVVINGPSITGTLPVTTITAWHLYGLSFDDVAHSLNLFNLTDNLTNTFTNVAAARAKSGATYYIGANPRTTIGTRTCDVAFAGMIKGQVISQATAIQYAANIRANLAMRGVTVG